MEIKHPIGTNNELAMLSGFKSTLVGTWHNEFEVRSVSIVPSQTFYGLVVGLSIRRYGNSYVHEFPVLYPYCNDSEEFMTRIASLIMPEI